MTTTTTLLAGMLALTMASAAVAQGSRPGDPAAARTDGAMPGASVMQQSTAPSIAPGVPMGSGTVTGSAPIGTPAATIGGIGSSENGAGTAGPAGVAGIPATR